MIFQIPLPERTYEPAIEHCWTTICFNNNLSSSESVTLTGPGAPNGSVMQTTFPSSTNVITDNNEDTYLGTSSIAPVVDPPTATSTSGTSYTIPAASAMILAYSTNGPGPVNAVSGAKISGAVIQ